VVREFVQFLFDDPAVTRIQADPAPANLRAIRCYENAGFRRVGVITTPDGAAMLMVMSALRNVEGWIVGTTELGSGFGLFFAPKTPAQAELGRGTLGNCDAAEGCAYCLVVDRAGHAFDAGATLDSHLHRAITRKFYIHDVLFQVDLDRMIGSED
jgi:hypothetical protein